MQMYHIHKAWSYLCIQAMSDKSLPDQASPCGTDAQSGHSSFLQHDKLSLWGLPHQKVHWPENQSLHIYQNKMAQYLTLLSQRTYRQVFLLHKRLITCDMASKSVHDLKQGSSALAHFLMSDSPVPQQDMGYSMQHHYRWHLLYDYKKHQMAEDVMQTCHSHW